MASYLTKRKIRLILIALILVGVTCLQTVGPAHGAPTGFLRTDGIWIINSSGSKILLRGANLRGLETHTENDFLNLKNWGFNVARLVVTWGKIEPTKGVYDKQYLSYVDRDIAWAKKYGIYLIIDMHQWRWNWKWGGYGAPDWAVSKYPTTTEGRLQALEDFWKDTNVQASFMSMWKYLASRYKGETIIAGYDILNEPWSMFDSRKHTSTDMWSLEKSLLEQVIDAIRTVDQNHFVLVDVHPASASSANPIRRPNLVWEAHYYAYTYDFWGKPYTHESVKFLESSLKQFYDNVVVKLKQPLWIGEFGIEMRVQGSDLWIQDTLGLFRKYQLGWSWWTYYRSGEPDMSLLNSDGTPKSYFVQLLSNPYLSA